MEIERTRLLALALVLLGCLNYVFAEHDTAAIEQSIHDDVQDPNFHRFIRFLTKISEQDAKKDLQQEEDKIRRSITDEKPDGEVAEFSEQPAEPSSDMNAERLAAFSRLHEMLVKALEILEKENNREEITTEHPAVLPTSLSVDSQYQNDEKTLREIMQLHNATNDEEQISKLPKRQLSQQLLNEQLFRAPSVTSSASSAASSSAASSASAASATGVSSTSTATSTSTTAFALPVPMSLEVLEELACDVESAGFGHSHAIGIIVHEIFCEARKLWHYLLHALHNLKSELSVGPQLDLARAYTTTSSGFLERSPIILEELLKEPRHLLTLPEILKDSVPLSSISKTLHRLKHAVHRFLHVAKDLLIEKHRNTNLLQTLTELKDLGLVDQLFNRGVSWDDIYTATATATSSSTSASTQNLLLAVKSMYDGYHASGFPEIVETATTAVSSASSTISFIPSITPPTVPISYPVPAPASIPELPSVPVAPVVEEQLPIVPPIVIPSSSASASSSATVIEPACVTESAPVVIPSSPSSFAPLVNEGSSSSAASAASVASTVPIGERILNRFRPLVNSIGPVISSAASSSAASSSPIQKSLIPEVSVSSSASSSSTVTTIEEIEPEVIEPAVIQPALVQPVKEVSPIIENSMVPEIVKEVVSSSSAASSINSVVPQENVASAVALAGSSPVTGLANILTQIRPVVTPFSNVIENGALTASLASLKEKPGHKGHEHNHEHKHHQHHHKQHNHKHHHHHKKDEPEVVVVEEVEEVPVIVPETPGMETVPTIVNNSPISGDVSGSSVASSASAASSSTPLAAPGASSSSAASSASSASSGGSAASSSSAASAAANGAVRGLRPSLQRSSLPLALPREMVVTALGEDVLLPGDIVTVTLRSRNVLAGRVIDNANPINMYLLQPKLSAAIFRSGGRVWSLIPSDFGDSSYTALFDQY